MGFLINLLIDIVQNLQNKFFNKTHFLPDDPNENGTIRLTREPIQLWNRFSFEPGA